MFNKKRTVVFVVFVLFMFLFITFAGGTPQNQAIATRLVTFIDGYSDTPLSEQRVIVGDDAVVPEDPVHDGFVFTGWYLESDRTVRVTDFTSITNDLTVVAGYGEDRNGNGIADDNDARYTVTFMDSVDNTVIQTQEVLVGMSATAPVAPAHAGMTFVGWSADYTTVNRDMTVTALYRADAVVDDGDNTEVEPVAPTPARYLVTFIDGDTLETISAVEVEEGLTATVPDAPVHEKRIFHHWEGNYANVTQNETVTAIYSDDINGINGADEDEEKYVVVYYPGLDNVVGETPEDENTYLEGLTYTVLDKNTLELENAVFLGWATRENNPNHVVTTKEEANSLILVQPGDELKMGNRHVTYFAVWAVDAAGENGTSDGIPDYEQEFKVTVTVIGGTVLESNEVVVPYGENVTFKIKADNGYTLTGATVDYENATLTSDTLEIQNVTNKVDCTVTLYEDNYGPTGEPDNTPDKDEFLVSYDKVNENALLIEGKKATYAYPLTDLKYPVVDSMYTLENAVFLGWSETQVNVVIKTKEEETAILSQLVQLGDRDMEDATSARYYAVWAIDETGPNGNPDGEPDYNQTFTVSVTVIGGTSNLASQEVELNGTTTFTVTPDAEYTLTGATVEGENASIANGTLTVSNVRKNVSYTVTLYKDSYGPNGEPDNIPDKDELVVTYNKGNENATLNNGAKEVYAYPKTAGNYTVVNSMYTLDKAVFLGWSETQVNSVITSKEEEEKLTLTTPGEYAIGDMTSIKYYAVWAIDETGPNGTPDGKPDYSEKYTVSVTVIGGTSNLASQEVELNGTATFTVTPDAEYTLTGATVEGENASIANGTLTVSNVRKNVSYTVTLYKDSYGPNGEPDNIPDKDELVVTYNKGNENATLNNGAKEVYAYPKTAGNYTVVNSMYTLDKAVFLGWSETQVNSVITSKEEEEKLTLVAPGEYAIGDMTSIKYYAVWAIDETGENGTSDGIKDYDQTYSLTVKYQFADGSEAAEDHVESVTYGENYSVTSPVITGYTASEDVVSGTMPNQAHTVVVTYTANKYTVTFIGMNDEVVTTVKDVLHGTTLAEIKPADLEPIITDKITYTFTGWNVADDEVITSDLEVVASYREEATQYTVTFYDEDGTTVLGTSTVGYGTNASYNGSTPTKANTQEFTYTFAGWDDESKLVNVTENRNVVATYTSTKNTYTVTFVNYDNTKLYVVQVPYGEKPSYNGATPTRTYWTFTNWDKNLEETIVTGEMTITAEYTPNVEKITAEEDPGAQLLFTKDKTYDISESIVVKKHYEDPELEPVVLTKDEYRTDFTTATVGVDIPLEVVLLENENLKDNSLTYDVLLEETSQFKFIVEYNPTHSYKHSDEDCRRGNCDTKGTYDVKTNYTFLEITETYDENIEIQEVSANYIGQSESVKLFSSSETVRWSKITDATYNPVHISARGTEDDPKDVMNNTDVISTLSITYQKTVKGSWWQSHTETWKIEFKYYPETNKFVAFKNEKIAG